MAPWLCHFSFTWTAMALIFTCPGLLPWWYKRYHRHEPHPTEARSLWYRHTLLHMHKVRNDGCTVNLRLLEWFMWLCDLNVNFCECLTAQVFREQMENKPTTWPHIHTCMGHKWNWNIYCMIPTSAWADHVTAPELMALSRHSLCKPSLRAAKHTNHGSKRFEAPNNTAAACSSHKQHRQGKSPLSMVVLCWNLMHLQGF